MLTQNPRKVERGQDRQASCRPARVPEWMSGGRKARPNGYRTRFRCRVSGAASVPCTGVSSTRHAESVNTEMAPIGKGHECRSEQRREGGRGESEDCRHSTGVQEAAPSDVPREQGKRNELHDRECANDLRQSRRRHVVSAPVHPNQRRRCGERDGSGEVDRVRAVPGAAGQATHMPLAVQLGRNRMNAARREARASARWRGRRFRCCRRSRRSRSPPRR